MADERRTMADERRTMADERRTMVDLPGGAAQQEALRRIGVMLSRMRGPTPG